MRARILGLRRLCAQPQYHHMKSFSTTLRRFSRVDEEECDAHMNELPVPCGPWDPWYRDKQSWYSKVLVGGVLWFVFSFGIMIYTDSLYLNCRSPLLPGPPSDMVEECEDEDA